MRIKYIVWYSFLVFGSLWSTSCSQKQSVNSVSLEGYEIEEGFELSVAAAEPLIKSPIAMDFDDRGRMWVLELPGYMANIDGTGENDLVGRIMILEDVDKDGYYEKAKPFLEELSAARAMKLCYGGLLFAEPPNLWFVEINSDRPGKQTLVDSEYIVGGNIEHQPNGLDLNIDNWIYSAKGRFRYRLKNGEWLKEATSFRGQWGITHDDQGRLFYNDNSNPLYGDFVMPNLFNQNQHYQNTIGEREVIVKDRRVFPIQATAVNRGYVEGVLDQRNYLKTFTSACGPLIFRGGTFPEDHEGNAFVCGPEANLVKRLILSNEGHALTGDLAYENKEFLISNDEAFRPVNLFNGPDGAMYIVDYHNGIIQHKVYMTAYLRELYLERGLDTIVDYGRILKVQFKQSPSITFNAQNAQELINLLAHKNGWVRDRAQQLIIQNHGKEIVPALQELALKGNDQSALHALWALEGLDQLEADFLLTIAKSENLERIATVVQLCKNFKIYAELQPIFQAALDHKNPNIDLQVAFIAGGVHEKAFVQLEQVLDRYPKDTIYLEAAMSGLKGKEDRFHYFLSVVRDKDQNYPILSYLESVTEKRKSKMKPRNQVAFTDKTEGLKLFRQHCTSCHGENGAGIKNLAPPLQNSEYTSDMNQLLAITLHGLQGPITVNGKRYEMNAVMPGLKDNPDLTDQKIANILSFVSNAYAEVPQNVNAKMVNAARGIEPEGKMFMEEELKKLEVED